MSRIEWGQFNFGNNDCNERDDNDDQDNNKYSLRNFQPLEENHTIRVHGKFKDNPQQISIALLMDWDQQAWTSYSKKIRKYYSKNRWVGQGCTYDYGLRKLWLCWLIIKY